MDLEAHQAVLPRGAVAVLVVGVLWEKLREQVEHRQLLVRAVLLRRNAAPGFERRAPRHRRRGASSGARNPPGAQVILCASFRRGSSFVACAQRHPRAPAHPSVVSIQRKATQGRRRTTWGRISSLSSESFVAAWKNIRATCTARHSSLWWLGIPPAVESQPARHRCARCASARQVARTQPVPRSTLAPGTKSRNTVNGASSGAALYVARRERALLRRRGGGRR